MEDQQIVALFLERSEQALDTLKIKYGRLFIGIALDHLGDPADADEVVSDLYLALWNNIPPEKPKNLKTYAVRILRNLCIKRFYANTAQKRSSQYQVALDEIAPYLPGGVTPEEALSAKELGQLINGFLAKLPARDRVTFVRRYYLAESPEHIGKELGHSGHYISVRLHRIREKLRKYLTREGIEV